MLLKQEADIAAHRRGFPRHGRMVLRNSVSHIHIVKSYHQFLSEELKTGSRILSITSNNVLSLQMDMCASVSVCKLKALCFGLSVLGCLLPASWCLLLTNHRKFLILPNADMPRKGISPYSLHNMISLDYIWIRK